MSKTNLITLSDDERLNGISTGRCGIMRNDTLKCIGVTTDDYVPFQNFQLAETMIKAGDELGLGVVRGGTIGGGRKVYLQMPLPDEYVGKSGIKRYITALNSHNGTTSIAFGSTNIVVICDNTFHKSYGELGRFRHNSKAQSKIHAAIADLKKALTLDENLMQNFKTMAATPLKDEVFAKILSMCFDTNIDAKQSELSKRQITKAEKINEAISTELSLEGNTLWGLFNGVTRLTNHYSRSKNREEYIMDGIGYRTNGIAYSEIMKWIEENTAEEVLVTK